MAFVVSVFGIWSTGALFPAYAKLAGKGGRIMSMTDPIADMLTRIRNASWAEHKIVDIPASKLKTSIARTLYNKGFIRGFRKMEDNKQGMLRIYLAYRNDQPLIVGLKRISKPGCRVYTNADNIPRVMGGRGIAVLTTPLGILTDAEARKQHVGGEVLLHIW
jgi:small subunit ribosomal protein S8